MACFRDSSRVEIVSPLFSVLFPPPPPTPPPIFSKSPSSTTSYPELLVPLDSDHPSHLVLTTLAKNPASHLVSGRSSFLPLFRWSTRFLRLPSVYHSTGRPRRGDHSHISRLSLVGEKGGGRRQGGLLRFAPVPSNLFYTTRVENEGLLSLLSSPSLAFARPSPSPGSFVLCRPRSASHVRLERTRARPQHSREQGLGSPSFVAMRTVREPVLPVQPRWINQPWRRREREPAPLAPSGPPRLWMTLIVGGRQLTRLPFPPIALASVVDDGVVDHVLS